MSGTIFDTTSNADGSADLSLKRPRGRPRRDARPPVAELLRAKAPAISDRLVYDLEDLVAAGIGSRSTLYKLADSGALKFSKILNRTVVTRSELDRYLANLPDADIRQSKPNTV